MRGTLSTYLDIKPYNFKYNSKDFEKKDLQINEQFEKIKNKKKIKQNLNQELSLKKNIVKVYHILLLS